MLAPRRSCLGWSKVCCDFTKGWLLVWNQSKYITYYILHILIPKSVLVFFTFTPTSFDDTGLKEMRNSSKIRPLDFEKKMIAQLRIIFCKIPMNTRATISVYVTLLIYLRRRIA